MTNDTRSREAWEDEVFFHHRWGRYPEQATAEHTRLKQRWDAIQPVTDVTRQIAGQIAALEICNWDLERGIAALCRAIGAGQSTTTPIGHYASITDERWLDAWAYYLTLRLWLAGDMPSSYPALLRRLEPDDGLQQRLEQMLGERTLLKELYVTRLCLALDHWLGSPDAWNKPTMKGHVAACEALEAEVRRLNPDDDILKAMQQDGDGRLEPCSHKAFRRYDIIVSSIGCGKWRGAMPQRGTDGIERAALLDRLFRPIEAWVDGAAVEDDSNVEALGERDDTKAFLASLLVSLLRSQERAARERAQARLG